MQLVTLDSLLKQFNDGILIIHAGTSVTWADEMERGMGKSGELI